MTSTPAPRPPLDGVKVVELATMIAVPAATHLLATQGASVIKVENTTTGDELRRYGSQKNGMSGWFANANAGKRSIVLDLAEAEAQDTLWKLIEQADVFVCGFRPGVVDRLGFGWDAAHARNPRLIWVSSTGFGDEGPYVERPVYDPVIQALAGWAGGQRGAEGPQLVSAMLADKIAALTTAQAITAALAGRATTGEGRRLDMSMLDANLAFVWPDQMMHATVLDDDAVQMPNILDHYRLFEASDGWVSVTQGNDAQWAAFCRALDRPELADDERYATARARAGNIGEWYDLIGELVAPFTVAECIERLVAADVPAVPVLDPTEVADDAQVIASGSIAEIEHPLVGRMRMPQQAARFLDVSDLSPAPTHGQHTDEILTELCESAD